MDRVLRERLSAERLGPYIEATGDLASALRLHEWNTRISGAFFESLQMFEVILRNSMHSAIQDAFTTDWVSQLQEVLDDRGNKDIRDARARLQQHGREESAGRLVAELNFGFWRYLLAKRYEHSLWIPTLRHSFTHFRGTRSDVERRVSVLNGLRNRLAHHEPIHSRNLRKDYKSLVEVTEWMCSDSASWITAQSRVVAVLDEHP